MREDYLLCTSEAAVSCEAKVSAGVESGCYGRVRVRLLVLRACPRGLTSAARDERGANGFL